MKNFFKLKIVYIVALALIVIAAVLVSLYSPKEDDRPVYEPAPPEAPRLTSLGVVGEKIDFSPETRYYEIKLPEGNPTVPMVWATAVSDIELEIYQAYFQSGKEDAYARILLNDGKYTNSYDVRFIKSEKQGFVLQYDDRYSFVPEHTLKVGDKLTYTVEGEGNNISVDSNGNVKATAVSDEKATVTAFINGNAVETLEITRTEKAVLNVFIVAGQGNAAGEGGSAEESIKTLPGTAYTAEINDLTNTMADLSSGRQGFSSAIAEKIYSLTNQKSLFIQTAVSDVSVTKWAADGEAYKMAKGRLDAFSEILSNEKSNYTLNKTICLWLQGEWDIAHDMSSDEYIACFTSFYNTIKADTKTEMIAIIPIRSSLALESEQHLIEPVCSAQYQLSNMYDDVRIITTVPENSNVENGNIREGNLYYTQKGYNLLGADIATNLYNCFSGETGKSPRAIEVFGQTHDGLYKYGETVRLEKNEELRTVALITPLYSKKSDITVIYDEKLINYTDGGVITLAEENKDLKKAEICFKCGEVEFRFNIEFYDSENVLPKQQTVYLWEFDSLNTTDNSNELTLSSRSNAESYSLQDGKLVSNDRQADFAFQNSLVLTNEANWDIEWKGMINDNSIILGNEFSTKGYIYLAPFAENMGYSVRMVDDTGKTVYISYGECIEVNRSENVWRLNYNKEAKTITLYSNGLVVSTITLEDVFSFSFTNLFGRYGSENVNYCYTGSIDYLRVSIG